MDVGNPFINFPNVFQILISFIIILLVFLFFKYASKRRTYSEQMPSTKQSVFNILGDLKYFPWSASSRGGYPTPVYMLQYASGLFNLFKKENYFLTWILFIPFFNTNSAKAAEEVLNSTKTLEKAWFYRVIHCWLGTGLLTSHGAKWKSRRKLLTPAFHFDILKDFLPVINEKSVQLRKILEKETSKEFTSIFPLMTLCSLDIICETTLGVNINAQENKDSEYVKAVSRVADAITKRLINPLSWYDFLYFLTYGRKIKKDLALLHAFTISVIQEKKKQMLSGNPVNTKHKRKPLMELLLEHQIKTKDLTEEDIREEVDTFTFEGHDTTSMALTWTLYLIGLYEDIQSKVHKELDDIFGDDFERSVTTDDLREMKFLECVLKESMRLYPPVPFIGRTVDKTMNIWNNTLQKGSSITVYIHALHRKEEVFPNPEVFDPSRFAPENSSTRHPYAYIPFSAGPRNCIGQRFAMMEVKTIVATVLRSFTLQSLDPRDKIPTNVEVILRPATDIRIKFRQR